MILAMGVKRSLLQNFRVYMQHYESGFRNAIKKAMTSRTIGQLDDAVAPYILRNEPLPPFAPRVGYKDGNEYWYDSSSHRYVGHVSVPLLKIAAKDDFLVFGEYITAGNLPLYLQMHLQRNLYTHIQVSLRES